MIYVKYKTMFIFFTDMYICNKNIKHEKKNTKILI